MSGLEEARAALHARQGAGARQDAVGAPAAGLAQARLGTAYFARKVNELTDKALYQPSAVAGWTRAHVICDVAYQARAISRQVEAATAGTTIPPLYDSAEATADDIALGATLPPRALRHLFDHSAIHLNVVWRDLHGSGWAVAARGEGNAQYPLSATPTMRARKLWARALDLDNGARLRDLPQEFRP